MEIVIEAKELLITKKLSLFDVEQWADLMEAWIGAVIKERTLYDANDPLEDLNTFLGGLLTIRYRKLKEYFLDDVNFCWPGEEAEWRSKNTRLVEVPGDGAGKFRIEDGRLLSGRGRIPVFRKISEGSIA